MRKNFRQLFEERKIFGFYNDELFVAFLVSRVVGLPFYAFFYSSSGAVQKIGLPVFLLTVVVVFSTILGIMKAVRGNMNRSFYARVAGRGEKPKTLKGYLAVAVLYLIAFDRLFGKNRVVKTRNYSP